MMRRAWYCAKMSNRKQANRAEAIVRGVGALIMLLLLFIIIQLLPQILNSIPATSKGT